MANALRDMGVIEPYYDLTSAVLNVRTETA